MLADLHRTLTEWLAASGFPAELISFVLGALPAIHATAIPTGLFFQLSPIEAFAWAASGMIASGVATVFLVEYGMQFLRHWPRIDRIFTRWLARTRRDHGKRFERLGELGIFIFILLPIPGSGVHGAAALAYIIGLSPRKSLVPIILGALVTQLGVLLFVTGAWKLIERFFAF